MKKFFKLIMLIALMTCTVFAGSHKYKKPEFTSFKEYKVVDTVHNIPMSLKLGVSEGKDLLYIPGYGRIFLEKTDYGYRDINNNMDVFVKNNGSIEVKANVTMIDLNFMYPDKYKKGEFYHSLSGFLHSHIYPMIEENKIKRFYYIFYYFIFIYVIINSFNFYIFWYIVYIKCKRYRYY